MAGTFELSQSYHLEKKNMKFIFNEHIFRVTGVSVYIAIIYYLQICFIFVYGNTS